MEDELFDSTKFLTIFPVWAIIHAESQLAGLEPKSVLTSAYNSGRVVQLCTDEDLAYTFIRENGLWVDMMPAPIPNPAGLGIFLEGMQEAGTTHVRFDEQRPLEIPYVLALIREGDAND